MNGTDNACGRCRLNIVVLHMPTHTHKHNRAWRLQPQLLHVHFDYNYTIVHVYVYVCIYCIICICVLCCLKVLLTADTRINSHLSRLPCNCLYEATLNGIIRRCWGFLWWQWKMIERKSEQVSPCWCNSVAFRCISHNS